MEVLVTEHAKIYFVTMGNSTEEQYYRLQAIAFFCEFPKNRSTNSDS